MRNEEINKAKGRSRGVGGLILIIIGACLLLKRLDLDIPYWVFSWQMIVIGIGLLVGIQHGFRGGAWLIMVLIGGIFLAGDILHWPYNTARFIWPVVLIVVGVVVLIKRNNVFDDTKGNGIFGGHGDYGDDYHDDSHRDDAKKKADEYQYQYRSRWYDGKSMSNEDSINTTAIFSGLDRVVVSKDFKGGFVTSIFGGSDINFMQADINGTAVLDITAIFGGCEIVVPSHWTIKLDDLTTIMGGIEDKRPMELLKAADKDKVLVLKGTCVCGGVEIKSYR
ncbi:cell wall-active antibiotics response protein [Chitinophaga nivalis]|uniref:Cell wall-active antibiotics response protein n=1 Tax=Chitinophaga nivalis TaxID=2991709 RepID=A0ABT3IRX4_9BACT|nr:cell wall-active antibiotics response protein [Chitinophaga nivalis]MCW3463588.1 cell wall-active antibiotics response protein [Chitinophaga nivalis]MCW3486722.1 cell wall-active antibiotics response protein [Chitinophaga nivalis]